MFYRNETRNVIIILALLIVVLATCLVSMIWIQTKNTRQQKLLAQIQSYQKNDPLLLAGVFVKAIGSKDFQLAGMVIDTSQESRLVNLEKSSSYWNMNCCTIQTWFDDSCQWGAGGTSQDPAIDMTMIADYDYGCNDGRSMSVEWIIIKFDQTKWVITDWSKVCITTKRQPSEACFP